MFRDISFKKTFTPLVLVVNILVLVIIVIFFRINHVNKEKNIQTELTQDIASNINDYYKKKLEVIRSISTIKQIVQISAGKVIPSQEMLTANLTSIKIIIGASLLFQTDSSGFVIASSAYEDSKTLVGNNYKFRPYFKDAMKGKNSFYTAVGVTTVERGMYFGFPVRRNNKVSGVVVVKFDLSSIDEIIRQSGLTGGMISPDGIIFSSPVKKWLFSSTRKISSERRVEIKKSRQLGKFNIGRFPYDIKSDKVIFRGESHFTSEIDLEIKDWRIFTFYLPNLKLNYLYPSIIFIFFLIIELLILNSIREFRNRRVSEITIKESRERFRHLFDSAMDSILILDHEKNIVAANPVTEKIFGYSAKELEGLKFRILFHGDAQREFEKQVRTVEMELRGRFEFHGRKRDGSSMYVDCSLVYLHGDKEEESVFFITCSDITEKREADILLHNAKEEAEKANQSKSEFLANMSHEIRTPMTAILGFSELLEVSELDEKQKEYVDIIKNSGESLLYLIDEILDFSKIE
ncbi:MAG: PAS domain S-box protein, partial [Candidatus Aminicenantes bacterium]|nr:PAS domain S-box protein [Candidatus Aminicenantes bacterium]